MSYEGFVRALCSEGHQSVFSCHVTVEQCSECGGAIVWRRDVDMTNGYDRTTDPPLEMLEPAEWQVCNLGHAHESKAARYKIPDENTTVGADSDDDSQRCVHCRCPLLGD